MSADPNLTFVDPEAPTLLERDDAAEESPRGMWRIALTVMIAIALPIEIAWFVKHEDPWAEQRRAVAELSDADRAKLAADWERFQRLAPDEQRRLRQLEAALDADADPESLRAALADYERWKSGLTPQQSASLVGLSPEQRIERVRILGEEQRSIAAKSLSAADVKTIIAWLEGEVDKFQDRLVGALPPPARERLESLSRRERSITLILAALNLRGGGQGVPRFENLPLQSLVELRERLSPEAQQVWDAARTIEQRKQLLAEWIRQAAIKTYGVRDGLAGQRIGSMDLKKFFDTELTESERNRLLALPGDEMAMQLKQEFLRRRGFKELSPLGAPGGFRPQPGKVPLPSDKRPQGTTIPDNDGSPKPRPKKPPVDGRSSF